MRIPKITPIPRRHALRSAAAAFALAASSAAFAAPALAGPIAHPDRAGKPAAVKTIVFKGNYHGKATLLINNGAVSIPSVTGSGKGTLVGSSTITGKGSASASQQCDPFSGTGSIKGAHGALSLVVASSTSSGCSSGQSGPVTVSFHGVAVVKKGTGKLSGASGSLKFSGSLKIGGTSGSQNGPYSVTLTGKLAVKA